MKNDIKITFTKSNFEVYVGKGIQKLNFGTIKRWYFCNYRPQRSWGKVMFLHVSAILLTGGGSQSLSQGCCLHPGGGVSALEGYLSRGVSVWGVSVQGQSLFRGSLSWVVSVQGVSVQGGLCPGGLCLGGLCPGGLCLGGSLSGGEALSWRLRRTVMSGRYAFYWNAFLLFGKQRDNPKTPCSAVTYILFGMYISEFGYIMLVR